MAKRLVSIHNISLQWISGVSVGIEFAFQEDLMEQGILDGVFGVNLDFAIFRFVYFLERRSM